ncbi:MAG TPA: CHASE sensor domain-containing protein, partial [Stellaceae bacterium]|nr:CHASE sensor domain-containing protein [Stellaceae bacterium]
MLRRFADLPIRWKLLLATILASAVAQFFAGTILALYDAQTYRTGKTREVTAEAQILAASISASLAFRDAKAADESLQSLKANSEIDAAGIYGTDGALFTRYLKTGAAVTVADKAPPLGTSFFENELTVSVAVNDPTGVVGTVSLAVNTESLASRFITYAGIF